jgi:hypothetical protein
MEPLSFRKGSLLTTACACFFAGLVSFVSPFFAVRAEEPNSLQKILTTFYATASSEQASLVRAAIVASPDLAQQANESATLGTLKSIEVISKDQMIKLKRLEMGAAIDDEHGRLLFTPEFFSFIAVSPPPSGEKGPDIARNNLIFVIGHHLALLDSHKKYPPNLPGPTLVMYHVWDEGKGYLQGWNDVVAAAEKQNSGKNLDDAALSNLRAHLWWGHILIAATVKSGHRATLTPSGRFVISGDTVAALAETVAPMPIQYIE